jgi:hypothetical protein
VSLFLSISLRFYLTLLTFTREARIIFKPGQNRDGYFGADNILAQVDNAIDIFEGLTRGCSQGLFLFDNAPSHQKHAANAISAQNMPKGEPLLPTTTAMPGQQRTTTGMYSCTSSCRVFVP